MEQLNPRDFFTPPSDSTCRGTQGPKSGWCSEKILLISKLQKWKWQELLLQEGVISLVAHQKVVNSLKEKWVEKDFPEKWERQGKEVAMKKKEELLQLL